MQGSLFCKQIYIYTHTYYIVYIYIYIYKVNKTEKRRK